MLYLCTIESKDFKTVFGSGSFPLDVSEYIPPKYPDLHFINLGQKMEGTGQLVSLLLLADTVVEEFQKQDSVPDGYDFTFRQEWGGYPISESVINKVINTLRVQSYPPMSDYLDAIVKNDDVQKQKYIDDCQAVKVKYPKFSF